MQDDPCIICRQEETAKWTHAVAVVSNSRCLAVRQISRETRNGERRSTDETPARSRMPAALPHGPSCSNLRCSHSEMAATLRRRDTRTPGAQHQPATQDRQRWIGERDVRLHRRREPERFASTMARRAVSRWVRIRAPDRVRLLNHSYTLCRADSAAICGGNAIAH